MLSIKGGAMLSLAALLVHVAGASYAAETPGELAARIVRVVDRPAGLVHLPRCGDGSLAVALAGADATLRVHGQDADAAHVAAARSAADDAGLLNRRIWIDQGGLGRLLPVGRSCDLVVLADLKGDELTGELAAEIRRVLHPWYGMAVLGNVSGELDTTDLTEWAQQIAPDVSPLPGEKSLVTVTAEPLKDADDWSHWWHGPDNNAVSSDTAYHLPETIQWLGKPYFSTRIELPVVSNGRVFMLWNGHLLDTTHGEPVLPGEDVVLKTRGWATVLDGPWSELRGPLLTARSVGSGVRMWHRRLSPAAWLQAARSTVVADGDSLLVADGASLLELNQATGDVLRRVETDCGEIRWMAVTEGRLLLVGGPRFPSLERRSPENVIPFRSSGLRLIVLDRESLRERWQENRQQGAEAFDPRSAAAADGRIFLCTEGGAAEAYRIEDGELLWRADTGIVREKPRAFEWDRSSRHPVTGYAVAGLYIISGPETDRCAVLSQADGRAMWDLPRGGGPVGPIPLAFTNLLWVDGNGLDPCTGEVQRRVDLTRGGCSRFTAAPQGIFGTEGLTWNAIADTTHPVLPAKSGCGAGQYVANGLAWKFPTPCSACMEWRGFIARGPAEAQLPPADSRLVTHTQRTPPARQTEGWTTYRGNAERSAAAAAAISDRAHVAWHYTSAGRIGPLAQPQQTLLGPEVRLVQPVTGTDCVVVAGADGTVEAIDLETGTRRWRAHTGGRIYSSPTIWKDRVFVGGADGCLYALALEDGRQLWRLRVAPEAGRMMLYDQLGSRWPVLGSPLVRGDRVYVTAGLLEMLDGIWAVAADADTGRILWQRSDWSDAGTHGVLGGAAQMCWSDDRIVYQGGQSPLIVLNPEDGSCAPLFQRAAYGGLEISSGHMLNRGAMGQEVAAFAPGVVLFGGRRLFTEDVEDGGWRNSLTFRVAQGGVERFYARMRPYGDRSESNLMPAWDAQDVAYLHWKDARHQQLALIPRDRFLDALDKSRQAEATARWDVRAGASPLRLDVEATATWQTADFGNLCGVRGCALAENAVIILVQFSEQRAGPTGATQDRFWHVVAYAREDGEKMWEIGLPSTPLREGLAVAADGRVVVALCDGTVVCLSAKEKSSAIRLGRFDRVHPKAVANPVHDRLPRKLRIPGIVAGPRRLARGRALVRAALAHVGRHGHERLQTRRIVRLSRSDSPGHFCGVQQGIIRPIEECQVEHFDDVTFHRTVRVGPALRFGGVGIRMRLVSLAQPVSGRKRAVGVEAVVAELQLG
jgi:outer membrane protein assembly factor BamB